MRENLPLVSKLLIALEDPAKIKLTTEIKSIELHKR